MPTSEPAIFVSYAHEDSDLAHRFAAALQTNGARVWLDQGELLIGDSLIERIAEAIAEFDFVAALVSESSVQSNWCRKEIALAMSKGLKRGQRAVTVLPLRVGEVEMPPSLADVKWLPLDPNSLGTAAKQVVADATRHLERQVATSHSAPDRTETARTTRHQQVVASDSPVKIIGVDTDAMGRPRNDGTRGIALYRVPLLLNRVPPAEWSRAFPAAWNSPPAFTTMHRPGIASVNGNRIVLDGTTIEELEQYHLTTLKLVVRQLNEAMDELRQRECGALEAKEFSEQEHDNRVRDAISRLNFEDDSA